MVSASIEYFESRTSALFLFSSSLFSSHVIAEWDVMACVGVVRLRHVGCVPLLCVYVCVYDVKVGV